ncbi:MAG: cytochrome P450 [Solirubrobacteraceae bacterium]
MQSQSELPSCIDGLPPGPRWPRFAQTIVWGTMPVAFTRYCQQRYGDVFTLRTLAIGDVVAVADPGVIKDVFGADRDVLCAGQANAVMGPLVGVHSLLLLDGERHLSQRRMMLPPFHGEAIGRYEQLVEEITMAEIARWPRGEPFAMRPRMQAITLEVILRAVIGVRDPQRLRELRRALPRLLSVSLPTMWAVWARPQLAANRLARLTALRHRAHVDRLLNEEIAAHRDDPAGREDILALLIASLDEDGRPLSDVELRDQMITLLLAGHETTATVLAWCFERLTRHEACMERLQSELSENGDGPYLQAVISETLRVRPVLDAVWRKLAGSATIAGYTLPAGVTVMPSIALVHHGKHFQASEEFRPERMLTGAPAPYTLIPFGGGPRRCIGAAFAMMEIKTVLRLVLEYLDVRADREQAERIRVRNVTLVPARGARALVTPRAPETSRREGAVNTLTSGPC